MVFTKRRCKVAACSAHTFEDIRGGTRAHVHRRNGRSTPIIHRDGNLFQRLKVERKGITYNAFPCRNRHLCLPIKQQIFGRLGHNGKAIGGMCNVNRTNGERFARKFVAKFQTYELATNRDFHHLSHRTIGQIVVIGHETLHGLLLCCGPSAHPMIAGCRTFHLCSCGNNTPHEAQHQ